ncbi:MAG: sigma-70 family RNA polymerase sigma factor [Planctomycetaceae bacterium]|nr:sigma-70 family RNA polymerase sigma factor [Planctomycetaceae bacterium]
MPEFPETSNSLIARVKDLGDGESWAEFLRIYQPVVYRMARRRQLQDADAQDVMQQVFLSIARSIEGWQPGEGQPPFRAWLTTIARNAITKALVRRPRDRATGTTSVVEFLENQPEVQITNSEVVVESQREIIRWAAEQIRAEFSEEIWQLFQLTSIEGIQIGDVASTSGRSVGSIYVARYRVIARLKEKIQEMSQHWGLQEWRS